MFVCSKQLILMLSTNWYTTKKLLLAIAVGILASILWIPKYHNNVCKTFDDYYSNRDTNENCYYNPDVELTVPEIVQRHGYPIETYEVLTLDGYILTVFRIPHGKSLKPGLRGKPVFLSHGLGTNSCSFVNLGNKSLAFILANAGYDVWLGNNRGTKYSLGHLRYNYSSDSEYWNFSGDEIGMYDIAAQTNLVYHTVNEKIIYIGYSFGTTVMYVYCLTYPEVAGDQFKLFINLAPAAFIGDGGFTTWRFLSLVWRLLQPYLLTFIDNYTYNVEMPTEAMKYLCLPFPFQMKFCVLPQVLVSGSGYNQIDPETLPILLAQSLDRVPSRLWIQFLQLNYKQSPVKFDYGEDINFKRYGSREPPEYNFTKMRVPTHFIHAQSDTIVTKMGVDKLYNLLPPKVRPKEVYMIEEKGFGHFELITSKNVVELVYNHILNVLDNLP